jgi:hypothetical protein
MNKPFLLIITLFVLCSPALAAGEITITDTFDILGDAGNENTFDIGQLIYVAGTDTTGGEKVYLKLKGVGLPGDGLPLENYLYDYNYIITTKKSKPTDAAGVRSGIWEYVWDSTQLNAYQTMNGRYTLIVSDGEGATRDSKTLYLNKPTPMITIRQSGSGNYTVGEIITFSGTCYRSDQIYMYLKCDALYPRYNAQYGYFLELVPVDGDTWEYQWDTAYIDEFNLPTGRYEILVREPFGADSYDNIASTAFSIEPEGGAAPTTAVAAATTTAGPTPTQSSPGFGWIGCAAVMVSLLAICNRRY